MALQAVDRLLLFSKRDPKDVRIGETIQTDLSGKPRFALLGWPDDRGIAANKGRVGAKEGPNAIRKALYRSTIGAQEMKLSDLGNLELEKSLEKSQEVAAAHVAEVISNGAIPICLGGGNDYAYADILGVRIAIGEQPVLGVINIDSHLDVRDLTNGITSGTPYFQALEKRLMKGEHFVEFATQPNHNSPAHFNYVRNCRGRVVSLSEIQFRGARKLFYEQLQFLKQSCDVIIVSLDIDSVKQADAPGCSAPYPNGLSANDVEEIARVAGDEPKVRLFSIYEVSPPFDRDGQTAALAASAVWNFMNHAVSSGGV